MNKYIFVALPKTMLIAAALSLSNLAYAGVLHSDVSRVTYHDFGQNYGRYSVQNVNALLRDISTTTIDGIDSSGGVHISYLSGRDKWTMPQEMISYDSLVDGGWAAALGNSFIVTVEHNGENDASFTRRDIGDKTITYSGIGYRSSDVFCIKAPGVDFKFTRMSKLITDVVPMEHTTQPFKNGVTYYRAGAGNTSVAYKDGNFTEYTTLLNYGITGAIMEGIAVNDKIGYFRFDWEAGDQITDEEPLPFSPLNQDSGSPIFVWDEEAKTYKYQGAVFARSYNGGYSQNSMSGDWTTEALHRFDVAVDYNKLSDDVKKGTLSIYGATTKGETLTDAGNVVGRQWIGLVKDANGNEVARYKGIPVSIGTWNDLSGLKDSDTWYTYGGEYLNASSDKMGSESRLNEADLYNTQNLVFTAAHGEVHRLKLAEDVDLGIGYLEFCAGTQEKARFELGADADYTLDSAGFVVHENVLLTVTLSNGEGEKMREWRKIGEGDLCIAGTGNNNVLLNVGRNGTTYLNQQEGYAAYNVLVNSGATVVIADKNQIARNLTIGAGGGTLDMNGNSMTWYSSAEADTDGFSIQALTQDAIITNTKKDSTVTLTYQQSGDQTFSGSFTDTADAALKIAYAGGGNWTLNSIHTELQHENSGLEVQNGKVVLVGTATKHANGSLYSVADDWHYADAGMNVTVKDGASFELGSHARLTGDVTVEDGGTYIMREGVKHRMEYIEGWYEKEDTYKIANYYGHKGDVKLNGTNSSLQVVFNEGTTANLSYAHNISGEGKVSVDLGSSGATLTLTGNNTFSGAKELVSGGLIAGSNVALGSVDSNKWKVGAEAFITSRDFISARQDDILDFIDGSSTGVVALQAQEGDTEFQKFDLEQHKSLFIGAMEGNTVQYGTLNTTETLQAYDADSDGTLEWNLGGGGGTLVVNYALQNADAILNLGNEYTSGTVILTNEKNKINDIKFNGAVTLGFDNEGALGGVTLDLGYNVRVLSTTDVSSMLASSVQSDAKGVLLLDRVSDKSSALDLTKHQSLAIGTDTDFVYNGKISVATNGTYHLGGSTAKLTLTEALAVNGTNALVVDAHGYSGGEIQLAKASAITGNVTVQGFDSAQTDKTTGDIVLSFAADNVLEQASSVSIQKGGSIDLNGTSQKLTQLTVVAGQSVYDSKNSAQSTLTLEYNSNSSLAGNINVSKIVKEGSGKWDINGSLNYDSLVIKTGTVQLNVEGALNNTGLVYVESGARVQLKKVSNIFSENIIKTDANFVISEGGTVDLFSGSAIAKDDYEGSVTFVNGGVFETADSSLHGAITYNGGGTLYATSQGTKESGIDPVYIKSSIFVSSGIGVIDTKNNVYRQKQNSLIELSGTITVCHGATLAFKNSNGHSTTYNLNQTSINTAVEVDEDGNPVSAGTLDVIGSAMNLSGSDQTVGGTLQLHSVTLTGNSGSKDIANLSIYEGCSATINGAANWNIHSLTGKGTAVSMLGSGTVVIDGAGNFSGTLTKDAGKLELADNGAVLSATVATRNGAVLALNADNIAMRGLNGNNGTVNDTTVTDTLLAGSAGDATSTRRATLTLSGEGTYCFAGTVSGDADNGLSIVKNGTGKQTFSGNATLHDITVNNGTLELSGTASVLGNMRIAQGSTLDISGGYSLDKGKTLSIVAGSDKTLAANLGTALTINGGTLAVDGAALQGANTKALNVDSVTIADGATMNIAIGSLASVESGTSYVISSGNWTALSEDAITTLGLQYMNYTYDCSEDGLKVTFTTKDGTQIWAGTESENSWNNSKFGSADALPTSIAIFNDLAENKNVNLTATPSVEKIYFDNSEGDANTYTISGSAYIGGVSEIAKAGSGTAIIDVSVLAGSAALNLYDGTLKLTEKASAMLGTIKAYGDATLLNDSTVYAGALEAENGTTLNIQGGTLTFSGSEMNASGGTIVMDKVAWVTSAEALAVKGTLKIVGESSWSGNEKTATIAEEAKLILSDKARLVRIDEGDTIIAGTLLAEAGSEETGASAVFESAGNLLLDSGASIAVGENVSLRIDTSVKQKENASATIRLDEGAVLTIRDGVRLDNSSVNMSASDNELWLNADSTIGTLDLNGTSVIGTNNADGANVTVTTLNMTNGARAAFEGVNLTVSTGVTRFRNAASANHTIALADNAVLDDRNSYYAITGTLNVLGGEDSGGILYIDGIRLSDAENVQSYLNVGENAHVVITGEASGQTGDFALSHWGSRLRQANKHNIVSVHGQLTSNAVLSAHDTYATINVHTGGELNLLKGLARSTTSGHTFNMFVDVLDGGTLNAAGGTEHENLKINLNSGATLGGIASSEGGIATFSNAMTVGTANTSGTVTIDTDVKTVSDFLLDDTTGKGGTIALTGAITSASDSHTSLELIGSGTLALSGTVNVDEIKLSGAHLSVDGDGVAADVITISLSSAYAEVNGSSAITGTGTLAAGTTISVDGDLSAMGLTARTAQAAYSYKLWDSDDLLNETVVTLNESFKNLLASLSWKWNEDFAETGVLTLTIPEPSMFGFLAGLSALVLVSSRRRRKIR